MSWGQLKSMADVAREEITREQQQGPTSCPIDGTLLVIRSDGTRNCPWGNYRWRGGIESTFTS